MKATAKEPVSGSGILREKAHRKEGKDGHEERDKKRRKTEKTENGGDHDALKIKPKSQGEWGYQKASGERRYRA
jgi:hypothetical protein